MAIAPLIIVWANDVDLSLLICAWLVAFFPILSGTGGQASGLAWRILESGYQLKIPRMFAALALISATGIAIFLLLSLLSHLLLRHWHESALAPER